VAGRRSTLWLALALALALGAVLLAAVGSGGSAAERILVAQELLEPGTRLDEALIEGRAGWSAVAGADALEGLVREADDTRGLSLSAPVGHREPISRAALGGATALPALTAGERVISLPLSAAGAVAGALAVGARVDVVSVVADRPESEATLIASDAEVVGIEADAAAVGQGMDGVMLKTARDEALAVSESLGAGRDVRLLVRPGP
jgi:Flp pilus assembly protein CpaB